MTEEAKVKEAKTSYLITITKKTNVTISYVENFVTSEKPTGIKKTGNYDREEPIYEKTFATRDCIKNEVRDVQVYFQNIDEANFDLSRIILAINKG